MDCPRCRATMPDVAHFCQTCGNDMRSPDLARRKSFAVKPDEPVASFALISTIMPKGAGSRPQTYKIAMVIALTVALLAAIFGALPIAVLVAAFAIPVVYIVYLYDVNLWEDEPVPVTLMAFVLTGVLAAGFTALWVWLRGPVGGDLGGMSGGGSSPTLGGFLIMLLLVPIVGEAIRQIGPLFLASRPAFDDLMDGLTFGVISGVAYATFDTIVRHWNLLTGGLAGTDDPALWASLIFLEGFVKPLVLGTASGIACAEFSGLGEGFDGFTPRYFRGLAEAIGANMVYWAGTYLFGFLPNGTLSLLVSVVWGLLILAYLLIRIRTIMHVGLMEAALERSAREGGVGEEGGLRFCSQCEMPLLQQSAFCNACGTATRVAGHQHRQRDQRVPAGGPAPDTPPGTQTAASATAAQAAPSGRADEPAADAPAADVAPAGTAAAPDTGEVFDQQTFDDGPAQETRPDTGSAPAADAATEQSRPETDEEGRA